MASSIRKPMTDVQKAASRQRIANIAGREYQGYKPGGDPRAAAQAVRDAARKAPPTPPAASPAPTPMGGAGGTQQMINKGGMTRYAEGGKLPMVNKGGEKVPFFAADGKGKMLGGGMTYGKGGMTRDSRDGCAIRGKTKGRMV